jgi:5'-deoxynucleotidase YfbR-like HD superfamily hydrolase
MSEVKLDDIRQLLLKTILPFHEIIRDMPLPTNPDRDDNDAEHSWSLAFMAYALAPVIDKSLDVGKVVIYALIHDLIEIHAGDTSVWANEKLALSKKQREKESLAELAKDLAKFPHITQAIKSYESKNSGEACFVYALDKFLNLLMVYEGKGHFYSVRYKLTYDDVERKLKGHREKAHSHPSVGKYYDELRKLFDNHAEYFYPAKIRS